MRVLTEDTFGVVDTVDIDELGEGATLLRVDAVGNRPSVRAQGCSEIGHLQVAVLIEFLRFHRLIDTHH